MTDYLCLAVTLIFLKCVHAWKNIIKETSLFIL